MSYFNSSEFACKCCGEIIVSAWLVHLLNKVRESYGKPMIVTSGYRCKKRNKKLGGRENSAHRKGTAADIKCTTSKDRYKLTQLALEAGFKRIGICEEYKGDKLRGFIHLDVDNDLVSKVLWVY